MDTLGRQKPLSREFVASEEVSMASVERERPGVAGRRGRSGTDGSHPSFGRFGQHCRDELLERFIDNGVAIGRGDGFHDSTRLSVRALRYRDLPKLFASLKARFKSGDVDKRRCCTSGVCFSCFGTQTSQSSSQV